MIHPPLNDTVVKVAGCKHVGRKVGVNRTVTGLDMMKWSDSDSDGHRHVRPNQQFARRELKCVVRPALARGVNMESICVIGNV